MAYSQQDIDKLKAAIATGAKRVRFGAGDNAHETEFRSLAEMKETLATMEAEVAATGGPSSRVSFVQFSRD